MRLKTLTKNINMKTLIYGASDDLIEVEGAIVNITTGLKDIQGRKVTSVEILPDDHYSGERIWKTYPHVRNVRIVQLKKKHR